MPKYINNEKGIIEEDHYQNLKDERGIKRLTIQRTKTFENLQGLEFDVLREHVWSKTDKLHHLSRKYYGTNEYWWVIGLVNNKPTDGHYEIGDILKIPKKPSKILGAID